jgi:hypothetical protein
MLASMSNTPPPDARPWRMVVSTVVTVAVLVVVFAGIFPKVADYSQAWSSIQRMPSAYVVALVVATVVNLAVYVWPLQAALPGLRYGPGFVVRQTSFAISNAVPAGGAIGLGLQYGMLNSYGFGAGAAAGAIAIVSVFNVFATLVMPVVGVLALLASGVVEGTYVLIAAVGVLAIGVSVVAFTMVLRSERGARTVGHWADRLADPLTRRLRHGRKVDLTGKILDFRSSVVDPAAPAHLVGGSGPGPAGTGGRDRSRHRDLDRGARGVLVRTGRLLHPDHPRRPRDRGCRPGVPAHRLRRHQQPGPGRRPGMAGGDLRSPGAARRPDLPVVAGRGRPPPATGHRPWPERLASRAGVGRS